MRTPKNRITRRQIDTLTKTRMKRGRTHTHTYIHTYTHTHTHARSAQAGIVCVWRAGGGGRARRFCGRVWCRFHVLVLCTFCFFMYVTVFLFCYVLVRCDHALVVWRLFLRFTSAIINQSINQSIKLLSFSPVYIFRETFKSIVSLIRVVHMGGVRRREETTRGRNKTNKTNSRLTSPKKANLVNHLSYVTGLNTCVLHVLLHLCFSV
jgi:hypothetical protein